MNTVNTPTIAAMVSDCLITAMRHSPRTRTMDDESRTEVERIVREGLTGLITDEWITAQFNKVVVERALYPALSNLKSNGRT